MKKIKLCSGYVGVTCINGNCPNALREEYPDFYPEKIKCSECFYNNQCEDCYFSDKPEYCKRKEHKNNDN